MDPFLSGVVGAPGHDAQTAPPEFRRRLPALPVATAVAAGITIDHFANWSPAVWLSLGAVGWLLWIVASYLDSRSRRVPAFASRLRAGVGFDLASLFTLLLTLSSAGGCWHHLCWSSVGPLEIAQFAREEPHPVRVVGRVADRPGKLPQRDHVFSAGRRRGERSVCQIDCQSLESLGRSTPVTGRMRLLVEGEIANLAPGDTVDIVGTFSRPRGASNPGGFDFRAFLRTSGVHCTLQCSEPEDVRLVERGNTWWQRGRGALRTSAESLLARNLSETTAPVGIALLLGTRTAIPDDLRTAFTESGTMHILAISGANVGILVGLLWGVTRLFRLRRQGTAAVILCGVLGYSFLADSQPPVLRAVLMVVAIVSGQPWHRRGPLANGLALAILGVLIWNPTHLFDTGAQLSFLAVAALLWSPTLALELSRNKPELDPLDRLERQVDFWRRIGGWLRDEFRIAVVALAAVWLFTLPLTMARFHLVSPVGFLANLVLAPLSVAVLWAGYLLLTVGLVLPAVAGPLGFLFDAGLRLLIETVESAAAVPLGHFYIPGPSEGWLLGFYLVLVAVVFGGSGGRLRALGWRGLLLWCVLGLAWSAWPASAKELRCTFLSVGHGVGVLVELPDGRTIVYDLGQMDNGAQARHALEGALWQRGRARVDALVLSHSDTDHFNGVPGLARTLSVGEVFVHSSFLDFSERPVRETCDELAKARVPIRVVWEGDRLALDSETIIEVLHPARGRTYASDNASSLVLAIEYRGRRFLLTGDLEKRGLQTLLEQEPWPVDVMLSPHHGALAANTRSLAQWATPGYVIVSGSARDGRGGLRRIYGEETQVLSTHDHGAITFVVNDRGDLRYETFRAVDARR
ncbi:MAG: ComEC/Rec2 family competence protein [Planctomycetota bacterium]|nr:ComEC/Rec2 family competence protein [Planctomycetota bacterium]